MSSTKPLIGQADSAAADATQTAPPDTLEQLMDRYADGSAAAFDELYRRGAPKLLAYLLRLTHSRERAEDLLQVTFVKVHRARDSYISGSPFLPWALAIARRSFYDERRAAKSRQEELSRDGVLPDSGEPADDGPGLDVSDALDRALDRIPRLYREAIQLTKITGLSVAEAADVLGTSSSAVKLRVHRGYNLLRKELESYGRK